jgi:hypothetical protein
VADVAENGAANGTANGTKLTWWILGIGSSMAVLIVSFAINKIDGFDHRIRAIEILQGEAKEHIRQLDTLISAMRTDQIERARTFGEIHTSLGTMAVRLQAVDEKLEALQHPREER